MVKVERNSFALHQFVTIGQEQWVELRGSPEVDMKVEAITMNVPCPDFMRIFALDVGGSEVQGGRTLLREGNRVNGYEAYFLSREVLKGLEGDHHPVLVPIKDLPVLSVGCGTRVSFRAKYTGLIPPGFKEGDRFLATLDVKSATRVVDAPEPSPRVVT